MTRRIARPVIIFAFTRPDYLRRLCLSLKAQQGVELPDAQVHLLQDGARSRRSGVLYGDPARIAESSATFREIFPGGHVHASPDNLGVAMNILRGERLAFQSLKADIGYFFEEDLELGPCYLAMLEALAGLIGRDPRTGYFAAYGDHQREGDPAAPQLVPLEHHWGFALTRRCWQAMQPWLKPFHDVYARVDYQFRPHLRIVELYAGRRVSGCQSSQDVAKTMACADLGFARVNTDVCYARYIGAQGESFRTDLFHSAGFDAAHVSSRMPGRLPEAGPDVIQRLIDDKLAACLDHRQTAYDADVGAMRARLFDPDQPATRKDMEDVWRVVMDRLPGEEFYPAQQAAGRSLRQIRRSLLRSREAQAKGLYVDWPSPAPQPDAQSAASQLMAKPQAARTVGPPRMSAPELALFQRVLASGRRRYAEFGVGGSIPLALRQEFEAVVGVESDPAWARMVREHADVAPAVAAGRASILHADIGPVGDWGSPTDRGAMPRWPGYIGAMWAEWSRRGSFPDLVLVDGRFRIACCFSVAILHAARGGEGEAPLVLLHDVSDERPQYRAAFEAFEPVEQAETLVVMRPRSDVPPAALMATMMARLLDIG